MQRRGFLGLLAGAAVAPFVPTQQEPASDIVPITLTCEQTWEPRNHLAGDTVTVRIPQHYLVRKGCAYQGEEVR